MHTEPDAGRRSEFERIAELVYEPVQRYLRRRVDADDVVGLLDDVLVVLWRRIEDVPAGEPLPWAYGVARNVVANHRRAGRRRMRLVHRLEAHSDQRERSRPSSTSAAEAELWRALGELGESDRELIRLWAWEQLEPREIAVVLDTTPNAVSVRLSRVRAGLRSELARQNDGDGGHEPVGHRQEDTP